MAENNATPNNSKSDNNETLKSIIYFILALLVFAIFKPTFEGLYTPIIVELFKDLDVKSPFSLTNRSFWVVFSVFITNYIGIGVLLKFSHNKYIFSTNTYKITLFFFLLFVFYRCIESKILIKPTYQFYPISSDIKFVDFIFIYAFVAINYFCINHFSKKKLLKEHIYKNDLATNTDTLGRNHASDYLASNILSNYSENAFAIGIMGTWGTGKTTFLKFIKKSLETKSKEQAYKSQQLIMIDFNAWFSKKPEQITQDFFDVLKNKIGEYSGELSDEITSYAQKLVTGQKGTLIDILKEVFSIFASKETPAELYEKINTALQKLNFKLVIFIDDLDRLDKKEIVEVLRIIRNTANFHNTVFVVAYDRNYVINAIKDINDHNKERYLEKIFQLEIALPYTEQSKVIEHLKQWLKEWIEKNITEEKQRKFLLEGDLGLEETFNDNKNNDCIKNYIFTMRDASRFYNLFITEYSNNICGEIIFNHFFFIKLILFKYPLVYTLLVEKSNIFFKENSNVVYKDFITLNNDFMESFKTEKDLQLDDNTVKIIIMILKMLFGSPNTYYPYYLFINHKQSFKRYFSNKVMIGELSVNIFQEINQLNYDLKNLDKYTDFIEQFPSRYRELNIKDLKELKHQCEVMWALSFFDYEKNSGNIHYIPFRHSLFILNNLIADYEEDILFFIKNKLFNNAYADKKMLAQFNIALAETFYNSKNADDKILVVLCIE